MYFQLAVLVVWNKMYMFHCRLCNLSFWSLPVLHILKCLTKKVVGNSIYQSILFLFFFQFGCVEWFISLLGNEIENPNGSSGRYGPERLEPSRRRQPAAPTARARVRGHFVAAARLGRTFRLVLDHPAPIRWRRTRARANSQKHLQTLPH